MKRVTDQVHNKHLCVTRTWNYLTLSAACFPLCIKYFQRVSLVALQRLIALAAVAFGSSFRMTLKGTGHATAQRPILLGRSGLTNDSQSGVPAVRRWDVTTHKQ